MLEKRFYLFSITKISDMIAATYIDNPSEEMRFDKVKEYKETLSQLGYIKNVNQNGKWKTLVIKDLDF